MKRRRACSTAGVARKPVISRYDQADDDQRSTATKLILTVHTMTSIAAPAGIHDYLRSPDAYLTTLSEFISTIGGPK